MGRRIHITVTDAETCEVIEREEMEMPSPTGKIRFTRLFVIPGTPDTAYPEAEVEFVIPEIE